MTTNSIWLFHGMNGRFASGVFTEKEMAEQWIYNNRLTGVLTAYPINTGVYDWAIQEGLFTPKNESQGSPEFIGKFTTAGQKHYHYENGIADGAAE